MDDTINTLTALVNAHGVSGCEKNITSVISKLIFPYVDEIFTDTLGNLIAVKRGMPGAKKLMLSAHMDSIGFIASHIEEEGFIRFSTVGGISPDKALFKTVVFENGVSGVIAPDGKYDPKKPLVDNLYIDIGARDLSSARMSVLPGDTAGFAGSLFYENGMVYSPRLDDRAGCLCLLLAAQRMKAPSFDVYFVFSVQEEVGLRGAKTAAYDIDPDYALAVDVTPASDTPDYKKGNGVKLLGGAAVKIKDSSIMCHPAIISALEKLASQNSIPVQRDVSSSGGTDAGAIHLTRGGVISGVLSIPTRYIHTPSEAAALEDIESCAALIGVLIENGIQE